MQLELTSKRLTLSALCPADAPAFHEYRSNPEVSRYQGWEPRSLADAEDFIQRLQSVEFDTPDTWFQLGIRDATTSSLLGDLGVHFLDTRQVEVGVTVNPRHQRKRIALEALNCLLGYLFDELEKHRVTASIDPRNQACLALLRRLGFRQEAHFVESFWFKGEWVDDVQLAMLRREWTDRGA